MIVNKELDNTIEGDYLTVVSVENNDKLVINVPDSIFNVIDTNNWVIGWGRGIPLYDAGCENIREIKNIFPAERQFQVGPILRGKGMPQPGQRIIFWNRHPSGFSKINPNPIINPKAWKGFSGESVHFSTIIYDSTLHKWVMVFNESDNDHIQIYAAESNDLLNWTPANNGEAILKPADFIHTLWASNNNSMIQTPFVSDIVYHNNKWYMFMHGYNKEGIRSIGIAISDKSILGPYRILPKPALMPKKGSWNEKSCFYAKISFFKDRFLMFYDGQDASGNENVGMAYSSDLLNWTDYKDNPVISQHSGWRSKVESSEPNFIASKGDSIFLLVAGTKKFKMGPFHHYITRKMYMDKSGNVDNAALGMFLSVDGGKSFYPHVNNPVFVNDFADVYENDHMGGNFQLIKKDSLEYLFYQAKSDFQGSKYNIHLRTRKAIR